MQAHEEVCMEEWVVWNIRPSQVQYIRCENLLWVTKRGYNGRNTYQCKIKK